MKKLIAVIFIIIISISAAASADYSPKLNMTISEYLLKYNAISAPLGSPYDKLSSPYMWSKYGAYNIALFHPSKSSSVELLLFSKDPNNEKSMDSGLDLIQIYTAKSEDLIDLISITARCSDPLSESLFGLSVGELRTGKVIRYYYENGFKNSQNYAYWSINDDENIVLAFCATQGYYFQICSAEDL